MPGQPRGVKMVTRHKRLVTTGGFDRLINLPIYGTLIDDMSFWNSAASTYGSKLFAANSPRKPTFVASGTANGIMAVLIRRFRVTLLNGTRR